MAMKERMELREQNNPDIFELIMCVPSSLFIFIRHFRTLKDKRLSIALAYPGGMEG